MKRIAEYATSSIIRRMVEAVVTYTIDSIVAFYKQQQALPK
jgi:hypothetical protein